VPNWFDYLLDFVDVSENLVMANDVATPSDSLVTLVEKEELEETPLNMNISQRSRTVHKNGAHLSRSFSMRSLIVS
jgi:hypothetical protein